MAQELFKSAVWQLIKQSDWVSKYVILLGLFALSVVCVAIIIYKFLALRYQQAQLSLLLGKLKPARTIQEVVPLAKHYQDSCGGELLAAGLEQLKFTLEEHKANASDELLSSHELERLETSLDQTLDNVVLAEEDYLPVLGISAAVGPLLGLFGTIWGLIHCFVSISQEKTADIATVAPGIAEALVTTLAGLIVAIPALVAFNYFSNQLRRMEGGLIQVSELFMLLTKKNITR